MIDGLIDKQDNFELVRDLIAQILADETASQQALATAASEDSELWKFRVYVERSAPWESWLNDEPGDDTSPIVNVWFDSASYAQSASNVVERQKCDGTFNIDCYGYGAATATAEGHDSQDEQAARAAQRCVRLVRNILMAATYTYLGQPKSPDRTVWGRSVQSISAFQPQMDGQSVQKVLGIRVAFNVAFNEFSPQVTGQGLETLAVDLKQAQDGQVMARAQYQYT